MGRVESAIRRAITSGTVLTTPARSAPFTVATVDAAGITLLLGEKEASTPITWSCLEGVVPFMAGQGWTSIGGVFDKASDPGSLDAYLKLHINRVTAGWVAAVLERAGIIEIDRGRPARVRLIPQL